MEPKHLIRAGALIIAGAVATLSPVAGAILLGVLVIFYGVWCAIWDVAP